jgi:hypothetical protein
MSNNFSFALLSFLWLSGTVFAMASSLPMTPFEAHYTVFGKGLPIGAAMIKLSDDGDGRYHMNSHVHPSGIAALLISEQLSERADGEFHNGTIRPLSYEQQRSGGKRSFTTQLRFDWQNLTLKSQSHTGSVTLPLTNGTIDPLSLHLQVMWDLQQGRKPSHYTLVDIEDTELKTYQAKFEGEELLKTPLGKLRTVRISQSKLGGSRITTFWFAPDLEYLTVQVVQQKQGQEILRMVIKEVKGVSRQ